MFPSSRVVKIPDNGIGSGYDAFVGFPISFESSGVDIGLYQQSPFAIDAASSITYGGASGCTVSDSSTSTSSASDFQNSLSVNAKISAKSSFYKFRFTASTEFNAFNTKSTTEATSTYLSSTVLTIIRYQLRDPGALKLHDDFISAVRRIMDDIIAMKDVSCILLDWCFFPAHLNRLLTYMPFSCSPKSICTTCITPLVPATSGR
jgi:hypothetical protein